MKWAGNVARTRGEKRCIQGFVRETWEKKQIRRPKRKWEGNIKLGWGSVDWIDLVCSRGKWRDVVNTAMSLQFALNVENFATR